jgi:hypothetical protein
MDPLEKIERKREARHRIRAQRERASRLKTRVVAISLICFALLWGIVFAQMATGNDPVLGSASSAKGGKGRNRSVAKAPAEAAAPVESAAPEPEETEEEAFEREEEEFAAELAAEEAEEAGLEPVEEEPVVEEPVEEEPAPVTTSQS